jgi:hypothetical protein
VAQGTNQAAIACANQAGFVQDGIRQGFAAVGRSPSRDGAGNRDFVEKLKGMKIKGSAKDQPSYRMIQSTDAEALNKQAADYLR